MKLIKMIAVLFIISAVASAADDDKEKKVPPPDEGKMNITGVGTVRAKPNLGGLAVKIVMRCYQDREEAEKTYRAVVNAVTTTLEKYKGKNTTEYLLSAPATIDSDMIETYDDYSQKDRDGLPIKTTREIENCRHVSGANETITLVTEQAGKLDEAKAAVYAAVKGLVKEKKAGRDITNTLYVTIDNPSTWITEEGVKAYRSEVLKKALAHHDAQKEAIEKQCLVLDRTKESFDATDPVSMEPPYFAAVAPVRNTIELGGGTRPSGVTAYPISPAGTELVAQYSATYGIHTSDHCSKK